MLSIALRRVLVTLALVALPAAVVACTPEEVALFHTLSPAQQQAVITHLRAKSAPTDCYTAQRAYFPEANGWGPAIIHRESRNNPSAANDSSTARGCWQLLMSLHSWRFTAVGCSPAQWADARCNTLAARHLYHAAGRSPWDL